jgi:hypothetical protein
MMGGPGQMPMMGGPGQMPTAAYNGQAMPVMYQPPNHHPVSSHNSAPLELAKPNFEANNAKPFPSYDYPEAPGDYHH